MNLRSELKRLWRPFLLPIVVGYHLGVLIALIMRALR